MVTLHAKMLNIHLSLKVKHSSVTIKTHVLGLVLGLVYPPGNKQTNKSVLNESIILSRESRSTYFYQVSLSFKFSDSVS